MAQTGLQIDQETFSCSVCLDLLKDPVTIPCGHSYCKICINTHWDEEVTAAKESYSCPQCRQYFTWRPVLVKNTLLAALVEELNKSAAAADHCYAAHGDVTCDLCSGRKLKAVKSCLQCLVSYCKHHLQPHYDVAALKKHKLVDPTENLRDSICSRHDEVMKMFCRTDQQCICYLCSVDDHKGHDTVLAVTKRNEMQEEVEDTKQKIRQRIQDKQQQVDALQRETNDVIRSADAAIKKTDRIFTQITHLVERKKTHIKWQIRSQQETEECKVKEIQDKLQQEITELKRKHTELDKLTHSDDHSRFIHTFPSLSIINEASDLSIIATTPLSFSNVVTTAVAELRDKLQDTSSLDQPADEGDIETSLSEIDTHSSLNSEEWLTHPQVNFPGQTIHSFHSELLATLLPQPEEEPTSRAELLTYVCHITLDPNTAHPLLLVSAGNNIVRYMNSEQDYCEHPDRFTDFAQVLSKEALTGHCYMEVKGRCDDYFSVVVTYKDIRRDGPSDECSFGNNAKSWALDCYSDGFVFWYNKISTSFTAPASNKIGIYVDYDAGILSFYSVTQDVTLIHSIQTTFTQPLHAGIWLKEVADCAEICTFG